MSRFVLIDSSIDGHAGHHLEYARQVLDAAGEAGLAPVLAANRCLDPAMSTRWPDHPVFQRNYWGVRPGRRSALSAEVVEAPRRDTARLAASLYRSGPARRLRRVLGRRREHLHRASFEQGLEELDQRLRLGSGDVVFVPTVSPTELDGLANFVRRAGRRSSWHAVLRRDPPDDSAGRARLAASIRTLDALGVALYADTPRLAEAYAQIGAAKVALLPIPVSPVLRPPSRPSAETLHAVYLGDARREKGYGHLPSLVAAAWDSWVVPGRLRFTLQSNRAFGARSDEPEVVAAYEALRALGADRVRIVDRPLGPDEYRDLLLDADLVLLPYEARAYRCRSSGIFAEARAAGVPTIVPADTWLAENLGSPPSGLAFDTVDGLPRCFLAALDRHAELRAAARLGAREWADRHNPARVVQLLLAGHAGSSEAFAPFGRAREVSSS